MYVNFTYLRDQHVLLTIYSLKLFIFREPDRLHRIFKSKSEESLLKYLGSKSTAIKNIQQLTIKNLKPVTETGSSIYTQPMLKNPIHLIISLYHSSFGNLGICFVKNT